MTVPPEASESRLIAGCGYLGQRVARSWQSQGLAVHAVTRSSERAAEFRANGLTPVIGDLSSDNWSTPLPASRIVLWSVGFDRSPEINREQIWLDGLRRLLDSLTTAPDRFLYVSSTGVYGDHDGDDVSELAVADPATESGQCCLQAEQLLREICRERFPATKVIVLRMAGIYGPDRLLRRINDLRNGVVLTGDGQSWLNLIHVDDAVRMINLASHDPEFPDLVNVVNTQTLTRFQYYSALAEFTNCPPPDFAGETCSERTLSGKEGAPLPMPPTRRSGNGNKRIVSAYALNERAGFQFDDIRRGLAAAIDSSALE